MKIAVAQLNSSDDINENLKKMADLITEAAAQKPQIIFFPENALFFRLGQDEKVKPVSLTGSEVAELQNLSDRHQMAIHFTSAIQVGEETFNASVLIQPGEKARLVYKKMHLVDISLQGQKPIRESDRFRPGS